MANLCDRINRYIASDEGKKREESDRLKLEGIVKESHGEVEAFATMINIVRYANCIKKGLSDRGIDIEETNNGKM